MHYLSVHDIVWVNQVATGETIAFDYEKLEEAMAAQYSYGDSTRTLEQAAQLLRTMLVKPAFEAGNRRTAFVATAAFLGANGHAVRASCPEAAETVRAVAEGRLSAQDAVGRLAGDSAKMPLETSLRTLVTHICSQYCEALRILAEGD